MAAVLEGGNFKCCEICEVLKSSLTMVCWVWVHNKEAIKEMHRLVIPGRREKDVPRENTFAWTLCDVMARPRADYWHAVSGQAAASVEAPRLSDSQTEIDSYHAQYTLICCFCHGQYLWQNIPNGQPWPSSWDRWIEPGTYRELYLDETDTRMFVDITLKTTKSGTGSCRFLHSNSNPACSGQLAEFMKSFEPKTRNPFALQQI